MNFLKNLFIIAQRLFFAATLLIASLLGAANDFFTGPLTKISAQNYDSTVVQVKDANNKDFILKYNTKNSYMTASPEPSIHETLGAEIGIAADININKVKLFPAHDTSLQSIDTYPQE